MAVEVDIQETTDMGMVAICEQEQREEQQEAMHFFFRPIFAENSDISLLLNFLSNGVESSRGDGLGVNLAGSVDTVMQATQAEQKEEEGYNGKSTTIARLNEEEQLEMAMRESLRDYPIVWLEIMARQVAVGLFLPWPKSAMKLAQQLGENLFMIVLKSVYIGFGGMIWNWLTFINIVLLSFVGAALDPQELYSCQLAKGLFGDPEANWSTFALLHKLVKVSFVTESLQMGIEEVAGFKRDLYMGKKVFTFVINIM
ncbi:hypothetical protein ACJX0J_039955 [Zea mays]